MTIREVMNKISWDHRENKLNYEILFIHRGAPMDRMSISYKLIKEIKSSWFTYENNGEEIIIPFHRIIEIRDIKRKRVVWKK